MNNTRIPFIKFTHSLRYGLSLAFGLIPFALVTPASAANVTYEICVRVQNVEDAGTDDNGFYATLAGLNATSTEILLDTPGVDDLNRGTVSCFKHNIPDIGHINRLYLKMKKNDDICIDAVDVTRSIQGVSKGTSQFRRNVCLGDNAPSRDVWIASNNPVKRVTAGKARGIWVVGCSGGQNCKTQLEKSLEMGTVTEDSWSKEVQNSVSVSIEAGVEFGAGSSSVSVEASHSTTRGSASAISRSSSQSFKETCEQDTNFTDYDVSIVYQWQVEVPVGSTTVRIKTCQLACQSSNGARPAHGPLHPITLESCKQKKVTAPAPAVQQQAPAAQQPASTAASQGQSEAAQLAAMIGMSEYELTQYVQELEQAGYGNDAIELFIGNDIAEANGLPSLSEAELDARLEAMGYELVK